MNTKYYVRIITSFLDGRCIRRVSVKRKIVVSLMILIIVILPISLYLYDDYREERHKHRWLINTTFSTLSGISGTLERLTASNEIEHLDWSLNYVSDDFIRLHYLLEDSRNMMSQFYDYHDAWGFIFIAKVIEGTANSNGTYFNGIAFAEDDKLDDKEMDLLVELLLDIKILKNKMSAADYTRNINITSEEYSQAFDEFFLKWGDMTYYGYEDTYESPFVEFLE